LLLTVTRPRRWFFQVWDAWENTLHGVSLFPFWGHLPGKHEAIYTLDRCYKHVKLW